MFCSCFCFRNIHHTKIHHFHAENSEFIAFLSSFLIYILAHNQHLKFRLGKDENNKKSANTAKCGPQMQDDPLVTFSSCTGIESGVIYDPFHIIIFPLVVVAVAAGAVIVATAVVVISLPFFSNAIVHFCPERIKPYTMCLRVHFLNLF